MEDPTLVRLAVARWSQVDFQGNRVKGCGPVKTRLGNLWTHLSLARQYMLADRACRSPRGEGDFLRQLDNFLAGIKGDADLSGDAKAGLGVQEIIERCYQNRRPLSEYSPRME